MCISLCYSEFSLSTLARVETAAVPSTSAGKKSMEIIWQLPGNVCYHITLFYSISEIYKQNLLK